MKFLKQNKLAVLSIAIIVLVAILLAIPGQFAHFGIVGDKYTHYLSGYQFIFNTYTNNLGNQIGQSVVGGGIAIIVFMPISIALICLGRKSSFFVLLSAIANVVIASLFFSMENFARHCYPSFQVFEGRFFISWVAYVCGAFVVLLAIYQGYKAIMMMKDEIKHPAAPKGPSYNYLKK